MEPEAPSLHILNPVGFRVQGLGCRVQGFRVHNILVTLSLLASSAQGKRLGGGGSFGQGSWGGVGGSSGR